MVTIFSLIFHYMFILNFFHLVVLLNLFDTQNYSIINSLQKTASIT